MSHHFSYEVWGWVLGEVLGFGWGKGLTKQVGVGLVLIFSGSFLALFLFSRAAS